MAFKFIIEEQQILKFIAFQQIRYFILILSLGIIIYQNSIVNHFLDL